MFDQIKQAFKLKTAMEVESDSVADSLPAVIANERSKSNESVEGKRTAVANLAIAGAVRRALALIADEFVLYALIASPTIAVVYGFLLWNRMHAPNIVEPLNDHFISGLGLVGIILLVASLLLLPSIIAGSVYLFYFSLFEASELQGTPGKRLLGLEVVDIEGKRMTLKSCVKKSIIQIVILALCLAPYMFLNLGELKNLWWLSGLLIYFLLGYAWRPFNEGRQTVFDWLTKRLVVRRSEPSLASDGGNQFSNHGWMVWLLVGLLFNPVLIWTGNFFNLNRPSIVLELASRRAIPSNTSGRVLIAKRSLRVGDVAHSDDFEIVELGRLRTPLCSEPPSALQQPKPVKFEIKQGDLVLQVQLEDPVWKKHP